jgi:hypothetical protein
MEVGRNNRDRSGYHCDQEEHLLHAYSQRILPHVEMSLFRRAGSRKEAHLTPRRSR